MKSYISILSLSLILFYLMLLLSDGCNPDEETNNTASYRIIGLLKYDNGVLTDSIIYKYEGDRLSESVTYSDYYQVDSIRDYYDYPDENSVIEISANNTEKVEFSYLDGKMSSIKESMLIDNAWETHSNNTYQYSNGKLAEEVISNWIFDELQLTSKFTYEYEGDKIARSLIYYNGSGWELWGKEEAIYTGNLITKIVQYEYDGSAFTESYYTDLQYMGSLLTNYSVYNSNTKELFISYVFTYDDHGNMVSMESPQQNEKEEYFYEEENGNFQQLQQPGGGIGSGFVLPYPTK
jgi:hypothetical protein